VPKSEACELFIEQQIKEDLGKGKTPYSIGKDLSKWIEKLFETHVKPNTIEQRAGRIKKKQEEVLTNVSKKNESDSKPSVTPPIAANSPAGYDRSNFTTDPPKPTDPPTTQPTKRKRAPAQKAEVISPEFLTAWENMRDAIINEKQTDWKTTSREVAKHRIDSLFNIVTM